MALQLDFVDGNTGASYSRAYARLVDAHLTLSTDYVDATVAIFYSEDAARTGLDPVYTYPTFSLLADEVNTPNPAFVEALAALVQAGQIGSPKDALKACLYVLLKARAEFVGAVDV